MAVIKIIEDVLPYLKKGHPPFYVFNIISVSDHPKACIIKPIFFN